MFRTNRRRSTATLLACAVGLLAALAAASQADAATIYACVKKTSGATRIVSRTARCKRGERRLSWSVAGPRGATGATGASGARGASGAAGANGTNGANGAAAGFLARNDTSTPLSGMQVLVSKLLPPGSFVFSAKTYLAAHAAAKSASIVECIALDAPGTTPTTTGEPLDVGAWGDTLEEGLGSGFNAFTTLPLTGGFSASVATTLDVVCGGSTGVTADFAQLTAIQTSQNS
jgi:hypothetical protein